MTITRNGEEIELTATEMVDAYYAVQHTWDKSIVLQHLSDLAEDGDRKAANMYERLSKDNELLDGVAYRFRDHVLDSYDCEDEENYVFLAYEYVTVDLPALEANKYITPYEED